MSTRCTRPPAMSMLDPSIHRTTRIARINQIMVSPAGKRCNPEYNKNWIAYRFVASSTFKPTVRPEKPALSK